MSKPEFDPRLYLVLGSNDVDHRGIDTIARQSVNGGVSLVQLREKNISTRKFVAIACSLRDALQGTDVPLLINDRIDVALAAEVQGVHIGQEDMHASQARRLLGNDALIGLTVRSREEINDAPVDDLDYMSIGGVFVTTSKNNTRSPVGLDGLTDLALLARSRTKMPLTAIAGIGIDTAATVIDAGVDGVAIISAICAVDDPTAAAQACRREIDAALAHQNS